jgi:hypothetical protein
MFNPSQLRDRSTFHPPFALLHAQDADGNVIKINASWPGHPLMRDAYETFESIGSCTKDVDEAVGGL